MTPAYFGSRHTARTLALQVLLDCQRHDGFVQDVLDRHLATDAALPLSPADRRLATHLAYGVLRRRGTLVALARPFVTRDPDQVEPWLWEALLLGVYQLVLLTQIPPHAALNETVELAAQFGVPRAKGFLNGVLRACSRLVTADWTSAPAADAVPFEDGRYRRLSRPVLPDPAARPVEYLAHAFGIPQWLADRWRGRYSRDEAYRLGFWFSGPAPLTLRVNPLRTTRDAFLQALSTGGWTATPGEHPQAVRLGEHAAVRELPGYAEGWFSVQDESAMRVAAAVNPVAGSDILDVCAAPGGKTTHLAELMQGKGRIVACDLDGERLRTVGELAARLGVDCIELVTLTGPEPPAIPRGPFDAVLVDVPCSNTGVLGKRPEARWRLRPDDFPHLIRVQERLLTAALDRVKVGGVVVYSTCSIEPEENGDLVRGVLRRRRDVAVDAEEAATPGQPADGGYWARLRKGGAS